MYSMYPACRYTVEKRGASSTRVVMPYSIKIKSTRWRRRTGTHSFCRFKTTQKLTVRMLRAIMIDAGNTETRPRSVIRPTFTAWSERDQSTMAPEEALHLQYHLIMKR